MPILSRFEEAPCDRLNTVRQEPRIGTAKLKAYHQEQV
jgi:hypothetical protein